MRITFLSRLVGFAGSLPAAAGDPDKTFGHDAHLEGDMRLLRTAVIGILVFGGASMTGEAQRGGRGGDERKPESPSQQQPHGQADVRIAFSSEEIQIVREHYSPRFRNLPPGLQKKLARGGQLPPGWQKKVEAFPPELERRLPRLPAGHYRGVMDGHAVIYSPGGGIVDVTALF